MSLVPADTGLEAEVFLLNKDSGFVYAGQEAEIKIESFPFTKYGTIDGKVVHVSPDAIEDEQRGLIYPARVLLARETMQADGKTIRLTPGMAVTAEIKTGKRHLVEYILAPIKRYANESLKER